ncbi:rCG28984 [Rattus norvegicus]|uniref:RCG28984 n=1 Tax=Rattus norvegicus TaxID=10116 RepID=A6HVE8_RAT|nr:rCG28984 [Rattus norvegicus]
MPLERTHPAVRRYLNPRNAFLASDSSTTKLTLLPSGQLFKGRGHTMSLVWLSV